jgi:hypothetical protein
MTKKNIIHILLIFLLLTNISLTYAFWASTIESGQAGSDTNITIGAWEYEETLSIFTDFEDVSKGSYTIGDISTYGYTWTLDDTLIGTLSSDQKNGLKSVRLRNGVLESGFSVENLKGISFVAGRFGTDSLGTLYIELSDDKLIWDTYQSFTVTEQFISYNIAFIESNLSNIGLSNEDPLYVRLRSSDVFRINIDDLSLNYTQIVSQELSFVEDFETAVKAAYAVGTVTINSLDWVLSDALIGTSSQDQKNGSRSVRLRNGHVTTQFKVENINEISFYVGNYNQTSQSALFNLQLSNNGINFYTIETITTTSSFVLYSLQLTEELLNPFGLSVTDGLYIRLASTDSRRVNIDDFTIIYIGEDSFNVN